MEGRSIRWEEVDGAEHPQVGRGRARKAMLGAEQDWVVVCGGPLIVYDVDQPSQTHSAATLPSYYARIADVRAYNVISSDTRVVS